MKTNLFLSALFILSLTIMCSCGGDSCEDTLKTLTDASLAFSSDVNTTTCDAYKSAWENHIKDCDPAGSNIDQTTLDGLICACYDLNAAVVAAAETYSNDPTAANCNAYKATLQSLVDQGECDPDGNFIDLINNLNC